MLKVVKKMGLHFRFGLYQRVLLSLDEFTHEMRLFKIKVWILHEEVTLTTHPARISRVYKLTL